MSDQLFVPYGFYDKIAIVAPGSSLTYDSCNLLRTSESIFVITIGDAWRKAPWAAMLYHCDAKWWEYYNGVPQFTGAKVSYERSGCKDVKHLLTSKMQRGIDLTPSTVVSAGFSGYQAINLAAHYRPKQLILLGYDMRTHDGHHNIIGEHPRAIRKPHNYSAWIEKSKTLVKPLADLGIVVYNCTIDSALDCFPKRRLEDVI